MVDTAPDARAARPRLVVSVTASADGRVTLNRASRLPDEATGKMWASIHPGSADAMAAARHAEIERRYAPQVILEGSGTFVADEDGPVMGLPAPGGDIAALYDDFLPAEAGGQWFAVVDGRGRIGWTRKEDAGRRLLVIVSHATPAPYLAYLRSEDVPYLVAGVAQVDLGHALRTMKDQLGATCVVSEAGGGLNGALLRSGLVDELHLMLLPALVGGLGTPTAFDGVPLPPGQLPTRLRLLDARVTTDGIVSLHYEIDRQPGPAAWAGDIVAALRWGAVADFDPRTPSIARVYDCLLNGKDSCADRGFGAYSAGATRVDNHSVPEFAGFFGALELVRPGVADAREWHPDWEQPVHIPRREGQVIVGAARIS